MDEIIIQSFSGVDTAEFLSLMAISEAEGYRFLRRLHDDWVSGTNRFSRPGEGIWEARCGRDLVAVGGLNRTDEQIGRLRRFYVRPDNRRRGVGRLLLDTILASSSFASIELQTTNADAAVFYAKQGFEEVHGNDTVTHRLCTRSFRSQTFQP